MLDHRDAKMMNLPGTQKCYIYSDGTPDYYKIGKTNGDVESRVRRQGTGNPRPLILITYTEVLTEARLHSWFNRYRKRGEWYEIPKDEIDKLLNSIKILNEFEERKYNSTGVNDTSDDLTKYTVSNITFEQFADAVVSTYDLVPYEQHDQIQKFYVDTGVFRIFLCSDDYMVLLRYDVRYEDCADKMDIIERSGVKYKFVVKERTDKFVIFDHKNNILNGFMKLIGVVIGTNIPPAIVGKMFYISGNGFSAKMLVVSVNEYKVLDGSTLGDIPDNPRNKGILKQRELHERDNDIDDRSVIHPIIFDTPSGAAAFVCGYVATGPQKWKTADGRTLQEVEDGGVYISHNRSNGPVLVAKL